MYIMWQQEERFFKYKANEIENFIAVYKRSVHIAIHEAECMIYQKRKENKK